MSKQGIVRILRMGGRIALFAAMASLLFGAIFRLLQEDGVDISAQFALMAIPIVVVMEMSNAKRVGRPSRIAGA